jgi:hypothetical protein
MFGANRAPIMRRINTISKLTEASFHFTHVTYEFHRVHPKWFPCPWFIRHKPCKYLASRLTLSPNGPKWVSTWPTSCRSIIGCPQNDFRVYGTFGAKPCTDLASRLTQSPKRLKWDLTWPTSPRSTLTSTQSGFRAGTFSANRAPILRRD